MSKIKVSEASGPVLDCMVAKCEGATNPRKNPHRFAARWIVDIKGTAVFLNELPYSTEWAQGGPIIEREKIGVHPIYQGFTVSHWSAVQEVGEGRRNGPTPLVAAMRCYVASKLGEEVEVPEELA